MQYMLLIYDDPQVWANMPEAERNSVYGEYGAFTNELREKGALIAGDQLQPLHLQAPSLMRAQITLHVSPFEFLKACFHRVQTARRARQDSRPKFHSEQFALGLQGSDRRFTRDTF